MNRTLTKAIEKLGLQRIAKACGVTYQAVRKWEEKGFPRTEWTKETHYAEAIETLSEGIFLKEDLLQSRTSSEAA